MKEEPKANYQPSLYQVIGFFVFNLIFGLAVGSFYPPIIPLIVVTWFIQVIYFSFFTWKYGYQYWWNK